jgi:hypothetical protein
MFFKNICLSLHAYAYARTRPSAHGRRRKGIFRFGSLEVKLYVRNEGLTTNSLRRYICLVTLIRFSFHYTF